MHDVGSSCGATTTSSKGDVAIKDDESKDVEILETLEKRKPVDEPATGEASVEAGIEKHLEEGGIGVNANLMIFLNKYVCMMQPVTLNKKLKPNSP